MQFQALKSTTHPVTLYNLNLMVYSNNWAVTCNSYCKLQFSSCQFIRIWWCFLKALKHRRNCKNNWGGTLLMSLGLCMFFKCSFSWLEVFVTQFAICLLSVIFCFWYPWKFFFPLGVVSATRFIGTFPLQHADTFTVNSQLTVWET